MTTDASDIEIDIEYEAAVPTAGGPDAADFQIRRPGHPTLEVALYLALDAKQAFEAACGPLSDAQTQAVIRAIAGGLYRALIADGVQPPAIITMRATDFDGEQFDATITAAGLTRLPADE
ncbi:MAG: hypothetical protein OXG27_13730 [Chloroflexi bacterium]|nr:hypothetical protein [Chloroflexota bacterium]